MAKKKSKKTTTKRRRRGLNIDRAKEKYEEVEGRGSNEFHELKEGWNWFYVCPPWSDEVDVLWKEVQQHQLLVCPKATLGKPCMLCDEIRRRMKKGDSDFADDYRLRSRAFFNAIKKADIKKADKENVKVLGCSTTVFEAILEHITDEEVDISDPHAACLVGIKKKGKGKQTRYKTKISTDPIDISRYITDDILNNLWDLEAIRQGQPATTKELRKAVRGAADDDDDDSDDFGDDELGGDEEDLGQDDLGDDEGEGEAEEDTLLEEPEDGEDEGAEGEEDDGDLGDLDSELDDLMADDDGESEEEEPRKKKQGKKAKVGKKRRSR